MLVLFAGTELVPDSPQIWFLVDLRLFDRSLDAMALDIVKSIQDYNNKLYFFNVQTSIIDIKTSVEVGS